MGLWTERDLCPTYHISTATGGWSRKNPPALARACWPRTLRVAETLSLLSNCIQGPHNATALFGGTKL